MRVTLLLALVFALCGISQYSIGQELSENAKIVVNDGIDENLLGYYPEYVGTYQNERYFVSYSGSIVTFSKFDADGTLNKTTSDYEIRVEEVLYRPVYYWVVSERIYVILTKRRGKLKQLFACELDLKSWLPARPAKLLRSELTKAQFDFGFEFELSQNGTKLLISSYADPSGKKASLSVEVIDGNANSLWSKNVERPGESRIYEFEKWTVGNDGDLAILVKSWESWAHKSKSDKGAVSHHYEFLCVPETGEGLIEIPADEGPKRTAAATIAINEKKQLLCAGVYCDGESSDIQGSFIKLINAEEQKHVVDTYAPFDFPVLQMVSDRTKGGSEGSKVIRGERYDNWCSQIVYLEDGGYSFFIQKRFYKPLAPVNGYARDLVLADDIILIKSDSSGTIVTQNNIESRHSGYHGGVGFWEYRSEIFLLYNVGVDNLKPSQNALEYYNIKDKSNLLVPILVTMRTNGSIERELVRFNFKTSKQSDQKYTPYFSYTFYAGSGKFIVPMSCLEFTGYVSKLGVFTFEK